MRYASSFTPGAAAAWVKLLLFSVVFRSARSDDVVPTSQHDHLHEGRASFHSEHVLDDALTFVTRPDIEAPRFEIKLYVPEAVASGYWFIESYDYLDQAQENGGHWTAPHIYDSSGGLIWSGAYISQQYNSFDFRISKVRGEDMITWLYPRNRTAIIMDTRYDIRQILNISDPRSPNDMHELNFVDDGAGVLYFYDEIRYLTEDQSAYIGYQGHCQVRENSFRERDMVNGTIFFDWSSSDHVDLRESTYTPKPVLDRCTTSEAGWDFMHANSLDKFPDGSGYLMSGRHTNTIYKIGPDGNIVWHLGGLNNDFEMNFTFARQHDATIHEHNTTYSIISLFDNAKAEDIETADSPHSRGVLIRLQYDVTPMKASIIAEYPHPDRGYTLGRASTQVLPNGNVFMCWVNQCLLSEHRADGYLVMEARVKQEWLKTYRAYKFDFIGIPTQPPDIVSEVSTSGDETITNVHASWNGATEVATWKLFRTDSAGKRKITLATVARESFETAITYPGYAKYVIVRALDRYGNTIGQSNVFETTVSSPLPDDLVADEEKWLQMQYKSGHTGSGWPLPEKAKGYSQLPGAIIALVVVIILAVIAIGVGFWRWRPKSMAWWKRDKHSYQLLDVVVDDGDQLKSERTSQAT